MTGELKTKTYKERVNFYYNLTTRAYQLYWGEHFHLFLWPKGKTRQQAIKKTNQIFLEDGNLNSQSEVIDLGCGIGSFSILVAKTYGCPVTGVNINKHQLEIAKKRARERNLKIDFVEMDIMELSFDKKFDTAFMIDVEPHLPDKRRAIRNIKSILKKQGRLVFGAWLQNEKINFAQKELLIKPFCRVGPFPYLTTFADYKMIFKQEGFKVLKFQDVTSQSRRSVEDFYHKMFVWIKRYNSPKEMYRLVGNKALLQRVKQIGIGKALEAVNDIFLGPIYAKLCLDAGVFKVGFFVVEKS